MRRSAAKIHDVADTLTEYSVRLQQRRRASEYDRADNEGFILRCETAPWRVCRGACLGTVGRAQSFSLLSFIDNVSPSSVTAKAFLGSDGRKSLPCYQRSRWYGDHHAVYLSRPDDATAMPSDGSDTRRAGSQGPRCRSRPRYRIIIFIAGYCGERRQEEEGRNSESCRIQGAGNFRTWDNFFK